MLDGAQLLDFAGPHDVFTSANYVLKAIGKREQYSISVVSQRSKVKIGDDQNLSIEKALSFEAKTGKFDTIIVVGGLNLMDRSLAPQAVQWIKTNSRTARRTGSICTGAFVLAAAGLLDGRKATTHWMHASNLQKRYPQITVESDSIWVQDGPVFTSAGVTSGIDLALALVEQDCGASVAQLVARGLVVYFRRPGSQSQFSQLLRTQSAPGAQFKDLIPWIMENLQKDLSVDLLADKCSMSQRHFARQFTEAYSTTPAKMVEKLRLESAKTLLSESELSIEQVSRKCGYKSDDVFRKSFYRNLELTPFEYRRLWADHASKPAR